MIIGGKSVHCEFEVLTWRDTGLSFGPGRGGQRRRHTIDLVVLHWTGGEGDVGQVHRTLTQRGLGVEFFIDAHGRIYQYADPVDVDCQDVGGWHGHRSVSIEIQNYGFRMFGKVPRAGRHRPTRWERIHNVPLKVADFWPAQVDAVDTLCRALCPALDVPLQLPPTMGRMKSAELNAYRGLVGHANLTMWKADPGLQIFRELGERWAARG